MAKKKYSETFRKEAVKLAVRPDRTATDFANELGIHVGQIYFAGRSSMLTRLISCPL
ncbi:MAG: transposase [Arenicellales bacterium]